MHSGITMEESLSLSMDDEEEEILQMMAKVHEDHHMSVVLVMKHTETPGVFGLGTGFIIKCTEKTALVMTCSHVIKEGTGITIRLSGSTDDIAAHVQYEDGEADLAILLVNMPSKYPELKFREKSKDVAVGKYVYLVAYYNLDAMNAICLDSDVYPGRICAPLYQPASNSRLLQVVHSCRSKGGCSGGPVVYDGKAIGVHGHTRTQIEYACSSEAVNETLEKWLNLHGTQVRTIEEKIAMLPL